jgi:CO/xanthine dehydrogenase FAD-binding subunit
MRADVSEYDLVAPESLEAALEMLAGMPGELTPIAGGTELMVALNTGRLGTKRLMSLHRLTEMRFIQVEREAIVIGAGATFTDLRRSAVVGSELPMLAQAASWTGSIANQNRGTLGGNIVNGSPAADSPPALLAYDATLTLVSARGKRTIAYREFHLGYKKTALGREELLYSISVPRSYAGYASYIRKVGTRNAQAISKVALAGLARVEGGVIRDVRLGAASLADRPIRCGIVEQVLTGAALGEEAISAARAAIATEVKPIDDIRSTAKYRAAVGANLLEEFLRQLLVIGEA